MMLNERERNEVGKVAIILRFRCQINVRKFHNFICQWIVSISKEIYLQRSHTHTQCSPGAISLQNATKLKIANVEKNEVEKMSWTSFNVCHLANTNFQVTLKYAARAITFTMSSSSSSSSSSIVDAIVRRLPTAVHPI